MTPPRAAATANNAQHEANGGQGGGAAQGNNQPGGANSTEPQLIHIPQNQQDKGFNNFYRVKIQDKF